MSGIIDCRFFDALMSNSTVLNRLHSHSIWLKSIYSIAEGIKLRVRGRIGMKFGFIKSDARSAKRDEDY